MIKIKEHLKSYEQNPWKKLFWKQKKIKTDQAPLIGSRRRWSLRAPPTSHANGAPDAEKSKRDMKKTLKTLIFGTHMIWVLVFFIETAWCFWNTWHRSTIEARWFTEVIMRREHRSRRRPLFERSRKGAHPCLAAHTQVMSPTAWVTSLWESHGNRKVEIRGCCSADKSWGGGQPLVVWEGKTRVAAADHEAKELAACGRWWSLEKKPSSSTSSTSSSLESWGHYASQRSWTTWRRSFGRLVYASGSSRSSWWSSTTDRGAYA